MQPSLIDFWSYSSLTLFLRNRLAFKKTYILKQYDNESSSAAVVGKAGHKALEHYLKMGTGDVHEAIEAGHRYTIKVESSAFDTMARLYRAGEDNSIASIEVGAGVSAVVWSPLGWGRLTGKIRRGRRRSLRRIRLGNRRRRFKNTLR